MQSTRSLVLEAALLLKKRPLGDVLAIPVLIRVGTLGLSVSLGVLRAPAFGQLFGFAFVGVCALLGLGPLAVVEPFFKLVSVNGREQPRHLF